MDPILELKIQSHFPIAVAIAQNSTRLARVMIAVMTKKDHFPADLLLQAASRHNFSVQESLWKKSTRLLAETDNRVIHGAERASYCSVSFRAAKQSLLQNWRED